VNNVIQAGPAGSSTFAFAETSAAVDPAQLGNNDFWIDGPVATLPPLYLDENVNTLSSAAQINLLSNATANVSVAPSFQTANMPHIGANSPLRGLGPAGGGAAPTDDYDGQVRPNPAGAAMDIGADEVP
jgi:hypothetical protein